MYNTIENPDVKLAKELAFQKHLAESASNKTLDLLNDMSKDLNSSVKKLEAFGNKKINKENIEEIIIYNIKIDINTPKNNPIPIFIHLFFIQSPSLKKRSHLTSLMHSFHL